MARETDSSLHRKGGSPALRAEGHRLRSPGAAPQPVEGVLSAENAPARNRAFEAYPRHGCDQRNPRLLLRRRHDHLRGGGAASGHEIGRRGGGHPRRGRGILPSRCRTCPLMEELRRVVPLIRRIAARPMSPVHRHHEGRSGAAGHRRGAEILNDITALRGDGRMARVAASAGVPVILMHMRGSPATMQKGDLAYTSIIGEIRDFLEDRIEKAPRRNRGGQSDHRSGNRFRQERRRQPPASAATRGLQGPGKADLRRRVPQTLHGQDHGGRTPADRIEGTAAAVTAAVLNGASIIRVHDVGAMKRVAAMADAIRRVR